MFFNYQLLRTLFNNNKVNLCTSILPEISNWEASFEKRALIKLTPDLIKIVVLENDILKIVPLKADFLVPNPILNYQPCSGPLIWCRTNSAKQLISGPSIKKQ